jgi:hypothetical protein
MLLRLFLLLGKLLAPSHNDVREKRILFIAYLTDFRDNVVYQLLHSAAESGKRRRMASSQFVTHRRAVFCCLHTLQVSQRRSSYSVSTQSDDRWGEKKNIGQRVA